MLAKSSQEQTSYLPASTCQCRNTTNATIERNITVPQTPTVVDNTPDLKAKPSQIAACGNQKYSYEEVEDLHVLQSLIDNEYTPIIKPPPRINEPNVVVVRTINEIDDLFEELDEEQVKSTEESDSDDGEELIYVL